MKTKLLFRITAIAIVVSASAAKLSAQTGQELTARILLLDSAFWNAYNKCDTAHFKDFMTDDIEFYHDKGGITIGAKKLIESLNKNICGSADSRLRREAGAGTVRVYPMEDGDKIYGAIISGEHNFYITQKGKNEFHSGVANFTQLWQLQNGEWKMTRILSYNHHEPGFQQTKKEIKLTAGQLDHFTGSYKSDQSGTMTVTRENNILILSGGKNSFSLYPQTATSFFTRERNLIFEFLDDAAGKPYKMIVTENGNLADELMFTK